MKTDSQTQFQTKRKRRGADEGLSLRHLLDVVRRRRNWVVIPVLLCAATAAALAYWLEDTYTSEVVIAAESLDDGDAAARASVVDVRNHLAAITSVLHRRSVLEQIVREFDLTEGPVGPEEHIPSEVLQQTQASLNIAVESEEALKVAYTSTDPQRARAIAARLTDLFIAEMSAARRSQADAVGVVLTDEIARLEEQLSRQEESIEDYKERSLGALPGDEATHISELRRLRDELSRKQDEITDAASQRVAVQAEMTRLEELGAIEPNSKLKDLRAELNSLLRGRYTERHPEVIRLQNEIKALEAAEAEGNTGEPNEPLSENQIRYLRQQAQLESLDGRLANFERDRERIEARISATEARLSVIPATERELAQLERDHDVTRAQYDSLLARQQDSRLSQQLAQTSRGLTFRVIEPARLPVEPSGPPRLRLLLMGLGVGLALACALTFTVEQTDASFVGIDEFHEFTDLPVLAWIPQIASDNGRRGSGSRLVTLHEPLNVATEQYRLLAMKAREHLNRDGEKVLMVTSSAGGEGKTTTSINLAVALSQQVDGRVLLIDCDLRWPRVFQYLNESLKNRFNQPTSGFADLLKNPEASVFRASMRVGSLYVVADDEGTDESFEALASAAAPALLAQLRERFDYVVLDAPPLLPMADSYMLATLADKVLLVVRAGHTRREYLERALDSFDPAKVPGVVLNDVDYSRTRYGSAYKYYNRNYGAYGRSKRGKA